MDINKNLERTQQKEKKNGIKNGILDTLCSILIRFPSNEKTLEPLNPF